MRNATEGKSAIYQLDRALQARRGHLTALYVEAFIAQDGEGVNEARAAIRTFNEKNPTRRLLPSHLRQAVARRRGRIEDAEQGIYLPKSRRDAMRAGRFAVDDDEDAEDAE